MTTRTLGATGPTTSAIGLGAMGMSDLYGPSDEGESIATIHAAIDAGVTLIDTGDFYGSGHNELLIARALRDRDRDAVALSVKFGALRDPAGGWLGIDGRPAAVKNAVAQSLVRLGTDHIDVYRPARVDPGVPIEETIGAIAELVDAGYVRHVGLSEAGPGTIRRAAAVHPIADLQIEYSLLSRDIEGAILDTCRELGVGVTAYGVLSRGLLSGHWSPERELGAGDFRSFSPRFSGENLERNLGLVEALRGVAEQRGATVAQVAIAWVLSRGEDIVALVGTRRRERLHEAIGATSLKLGPDDLGAIEAAVPAGAAAGTRYPRDAHARARLRASRVGCAACCTATRHPPSSSPRASCSTTAPGRRRSAWTPSPSRTTSSPGATMAGTGRRRSPGSARSASGRAPHGSAPAC
jgi:aryl-alcohol dehydrogenase-like predicted oxidoreductase